MPQRLVANDLARPGDIDSACSFGREQGREERAVELGKAVIAQVGEVDPAHRRVDGLVRVVARKVGQRPPAHKVEVFGVTQV